MKRLRGRLIRELIKIWTSNRSAGIESVWVTGNPSYHIDLCEIIPYSGFEFTIRFLYTPREDLPSTHYLWTIRIDDNHKTTARISELRETLKLLRKADEKI